MRIILLLIFSVIILAVSITAFDVYTSDGRKVAKVMNRTREPIMVIDTVRLDTGYVKVILNSRFGGQRHAVKASSGLRMFPVVTPILQSPGQAIHSYGVEIDKDGNYFEIRSDDNTDTSKVVYWVLIN